MFAASSQQWQQTQEQMAKCARMHGNHSTRITDTTSIVLAVQHQFIVRRRELVPDQELQEPVRQEERPAIQAEEDFDLA